MPVSWTVRTTKAPSRTTETSTRPFSLLYFTALSQRLRTISPRIFSAPQTVSCPPVSEKTMPRCRAAAARAAIDPSHRA